MNRRGPVAWLFAGTVVTPSLILAACQPSETPPMLELLASPKKLQAAELGERS